ncbi:MAG TPA: sterol desaturase family protein [Vicinamibacteria bacterium]|nr:sterol desaturase family protein [Vicinamibacteria bacterium]
MAVRPATDLMGEWLDVLLAALARARDVWLRPQVAGSALTLLLVTLVAVRVRFGAGGWRRLLTRSARTDAVYTAFYVGGFYAFFVSGPCYLALGWLTDRYAPFLRLNLLGTLPPLLQFLIASVAMDGVLYWTHRWMHATPALWAFHSVHHSSRELTPLANFRFHVGDVFLRGLTQFVPSLLLGVPTHVFVPLVWLQMALDGLAHSGLGWSYGPLEHVIVSPRFHRIHHSADPADQRRNFGMTYSFWDRLFRTGRPDDQPPPAYGLAGEPIPESFLRQLALPFLLLATTIRSPAMQQIDGPGATPAGPRGGGAA